MTDTTTVAAAPATPVGDTPAQKLRKLVVLVLAAKYLYSQGAFSVLHQADFFAKVDALLAPPVPEPTPVDETPCPPGDPT